ncbi:alcohol dehydrogenase catalytic domain-containing protein [Microbacterium sp.]|uniref:alcohol dehydrogenase catalytic domain-containing protein n=1 Tax=Microbacterium sp. TaxID=51671 RepID=UPI002733DA49|nr:zinc-binding dehydrogenase [Microbacterium sp.]MDP3952589.1 zinc-binding dehydrogenase [Microbacterium sp.]
MRAIVQREFGAAGVLVIEDVDVPEPAEGEVRVRVAAAGVHAVDTNIRQGDSPPSMPRPSLPMTPGREIAGIVDAVGPDVDGALIGTRVVAHVGFRSGGYAEFAVAAAGALHTVPDGVDFAQAVAAIGTGRTAQLVLDSAQVQPADVVIVPGASGGLGSQLVQLALSIGAVVVALYGGSAKRAVVEGLASDAERFFALDATDEAWPSQMAALLGEREPSLLIDGVGGVVGRAAFETLGRGGRVVIIGWSSGEAVRIETDDLLARSLSVTVPLGRPVPQLRELEARALAAVAEGRVRPPVDEYPPERAADAHAAIEHRRQRGKVVLIP